MIRIDLLPNKTRPEESSLLTRLVAGAALLAVLLIAAGVFRLAWRYHSEIIPGLERTRAAHAARRDDARERSEELASAYYQTHRIAPAVYAARILYRDRAAWAGALSDLKRAAAPDLAGDGGEIRHLWLTRIRGRERRLDVLGRVEASAPEAVLPDLIAGRFRRVFANAPRPEVGMTAEAGAGTAAAERARSFEIDLELR